MTDTFSLLLFAACHDPQGQSLLENLIPSLNSSTLYEAMGLSLSHRVTYPLTAAIQRKSVDCGLRWEAEELQKMLDMRHTVVTNESIRLIRALEDSGVSFTVLKGIALDALLYPQESPRMYNDLDILVPPLQADQAHQVLIDSGYRQGELAANGVVEEFSESRIAGYMDELQHAPEYVKIDSATRMPLKIDLHHRLSTVFDHIKVNVGALRSETYSTRYGNIPALAPTDMLCHLSYHAWWDTQSLSNTVYRYDLRLYRFADIRLLVTKMKVSLKDALKRSETLGCWDTVNWALTVVHNLWPEDVPVVPEMDTRQAEEFDRLLSDRWLQRSTSDPFLVWDSPSWTRIQDPRRADAILHKFFVGYLDPHLKHGDVLQWLDRGPSE